MDEELGESRPKIYRLPQNTVKEGEVYASRAVIIVCLALAVAVLAPALWSLAKKQKAQSVETISSQPAETALLDAQAIPIRDSNGQVIGQMAKMPEEGERSVSVNTTAKVDHKSGKELLNIISKY